jgi:hypothetical protein
MTQQPRTRRQILHKAGRFAGGAVAAAGLASLVWRTSAVKAHGAGVAGGGGLGNPVSGALRTQAPELILPDWGIPQGGNFVAIVIGSDITAVRVTFRGRAVTAVPDGGGWLAFFGTGQRVGDTAQHAPGGYDVEAAVTVPNAGTRILRGAVTVTPTPFPVEAITLGPAETALLDPALIAREIATMQAFLAESTPRRAWDGFFLRPTAGPITDVFGSRRSYNGGPAVGSHSGVDFGADAGTPVRAAAPGRVVHAGPLPVRGNAVYLDHGAGVFTGHCHLSRIIVEPEQEVVAGGQIGNVGATGLVTGPHLHWEVIVGGYHVDGLGWLAVGG